jgi:hypothetical protein
VNPAGDSAATDAEATLDLAARVHNEALARVDDEAARLKQEGTAAVFCDAPPVPLVAAARAGIPGVLMANFTWADIYAPLARRIGGDATRFVNDLRRAYRHATTVFRIEPALAMRDLTPRVINAGMVVTPGRHRRKELQRHLGLGPGEKLVYFYVGRYGQSNLGWERLARLEQIHFVGFHPPPAVIGPLRNLHVLSAKDWTGADLAASTDAVVAKAGYGTVCEAFASGTPLIYPPRAGFAEHRALDRALRAWGGGVPASSRDFAELRLEKLLDRALALAPGPPPIPTDGAARVARHLERLCRKGLEEAG